MKKLIISKTLLFLFIVLFISGFTNVFGNENSLIGVTIVIAFLMYLERDLTVHPWRNFFMILSINLLQGLFGHLAAMNMWLAIPLNFIAMFFVGYLFTYNVKKSLYVIFGLQYLFILTTPVPTEDLPLRFLALASGAVIVMLVQLLANRDKLSKAGRQHLHSICDRLMDKLDSISSGQDHTPYNESIESAIKELRKIIIFRRHKGYYLSNESRLMLKISASLEKIDMLLNRFDEGEDKEVVIAACKLELEYVKQMIDKNQPESDKVHVLHNLKVKKVDSMYIHELANSFELLGHLFNVLNDSEKSDLKKIEKLADIPSRYTSSYQLFVNFNRHSVRFTYAIRLGIMIAITAFITDYFDLEQGKWLIFTILSVTQPYSEQAKYRFSARIMGTLIGAFIFVVLFSIFTDTTSRSMIILLFGYLNSYAVQYRTLIITVTISALGSAALIGDPNIVTMERVIYVAAGIVCGMIANRLIYPHSIQKGTSTLVQIYKDTSRTLMEEVYKCFDNNIHSHSVNNLFAITSFIEDRILLNNTIMELDHSSHYLEKQRKLNNSIYELFLRIQRNKVDIITTQLILEDIDQIIKSSEIQSDQIIKQLKEESTHVVDIDDRILLLDVIGIYEEFKHISEYSVTLNRIKS